MATGPGHVPLRGVASLVAREPTPGLWGTRRD